MTHKHFLRQLSPAFARDYCARRSLQLPHELARGASDKISNGIADSIMASDDDAAQHILSEISRCEPFISEQGQSALLSAIRDDPDLVASSATLANPEERAVWVLLNHSDRFERAEAFLFADYRTEGRFGRDYVLTTGGTVSVDEQVHEEFATAVGHFFRQRDGSGRHCKIEMATRGEQDSVQVTIFIEGLPRNEMQAVRGTFARVNSWPTVEAAIIYSPGNGRLTVVAGGGRPVHEQLQVAFARIMLKATPGSAVGKQASFLLDQLVPDRGLQAIPGLGVAGVRVRKLRLRPRNGGGVLTVEAPVSPPSSSVFDVSAQWFKDGTKLLERFVIDGATITLHYAPGPGRMRAKAINIEMTRSGASNVKRLPASDRRVAEAHLKEWGLIPGP